MLRPLTRAGLAGCVLAGLVAVPARAIDPTRDRGHHRRRRPRHRADRAHRRVAPWLGGAGRRQSQAPDDRWSRVSRRRCFPVVHAQPVRGAGGSHRRALGSGCRSTGLSATAGTAASSCRSRSRSTNWPCAICPTTHRASRPTARPTPTRPTCGTRSGSGGRPRRPTIRAAPFPEGGVGRRPIPVAGLDLNDEVAFMASDAGAAAPSTAGCPRASSGCRGSRSSTPTTPSTRATST